MKITVSTDRPEIVGQVSHLWDPIYDSYLFRTFKASIGGNEVGVAALMKPRAFLEQHLRELGLNAEQFLEIGALYVDPAHRHLKIGSQLVMLQENFLLANDTQGVCCVMEWNTPSQKMFASLNYKPVGEFDGVDGRNLVFISPER